MIFSNFLFSLTLISPLYSFLSLTYFGLCCSFYILLSLKQRSLNWDLVSSQMEALNAVNFPFQYCFSCISHILLYCTFIFLGLLFKILFENFLFYELFSSVWLNLHMFRNFSVAFLLLNSSLIPLCSKNILYRILLNLLRFCFMTQSIIYLDECSMVA